MPADVSLLANVPIFKMLDDEERTFLAAHIDHLHFPAWKTIYRAGEAGGAMYVVSTGQVQVWLFDEDHQRVDLGITEPGELFGELSFLDEEPHATTATAVTDSDVLMVDREDLRLLFAFKPDSALDVVSALGKRIRVTEETVRTRVTRNPNEVFEEHATLGQRLADTIASFGGSWKFVSLFMGLLIGWIILNSLLGHPPDPYPFILLNLVLSMLAALQAPIIMMSQNRADAKDRLRAELDYQVNLKAELEVAELHEKVDALQDDVRRRAAAK